MHLQLIDRIGKSAVNDFNYLVPKKEKKKIHNLQVKPD